jgi:hypothetical protein
MLGKGKQAHSTECSDEIQKGKEEEIQRSGDSPASDNILGAQYAKNSYHIPPLISFLCSIDPLSASLKSFRIGIEVDEQSSPPATWRRVCHTQKHHRIPLISFFCSRDPRHMLQYLVSLKTLRIGIEVKNWNPLHLRTEETSAV